MEPRVMLATGLSDIFDPLSLVVRIPPVLWALTVHEFMHAYVALRCGDDTAYLLGRVSLNPLRHLDPLGTIALMIGPIGWAKPVPVNFYNLRHPRRDDILVSLAGVTSNFAMGIAFCLLFRFLAAAGIHATSPWAKILMMMAAVAAPLNFGLAIFNLLPIYPLDGHHVVRELLPYPANERFMEFSRFGPILLLGLVLLNRGAGLQLIWKPIWPLMQFFAGNAGFLWFANYYPYG